MKRSLAYRRNNRLGVLLSVAAPLLNLGSVHAKPIMPVDAPIPRLLQNVSTYVKRNPRDPNGYYTLGRIHYYAFAAPARQTMPVTRYSGEANTTELPSGVPFGNPGRVPADAQKPQGKPLSRTERIAHIQAAIRNLRRAIALEQSGAVSSEPSRKGLSELTLACVYEEGKADATKLWRDQAIQFYRLAFERSRKEAIQRPTAPIFGIESLVCHEAAKSYLRLVKQGRVHFEEKPKVAEVERTLEQLRRLPQSNVVTPIIFSLKRAHPLSSLIAPHPQGMAFDLDGSGRTGQRYTTWPRSSTGILVWDPTHTGHIGSGRQLFGTATWWMFWQNGYRALQSLDDSHDGWLTGHEMSGLAVWTDANSNGRCDRDEVCSLSEAGIAGINVRESRRIPGGWESRKGLRLRNGTVLPTYDWLAETVGTAR
ncbi:MAG: hypothetical protein V4671_33900 [Armatimonadota bacterium]